MQALVTGASGHLGANLIRELLTEGWNVRGLVHNDKRALEGLDIECVEGNILDAYSLINAFKGADVVFHLAARISITDQNKNDISDLNVTGVRNVIEACRKNSVRKLIHASSFHAHEQRPMDAPLTETRPLVTSQKYPCYNYTKAIGEKLISETSRDDFCSIIFNPTGIIGPSDFQPSHFGATLILIGSGKMPALVRAGLNWVDARDVAKAMITAADRINCNTKYIIGGHWADLETLSKMIGETTGRKSPVINLPLPIAKAFAPIAQIWDSLRGNRPLFTPISLKELESNPNIDYSKAKSELDYIPRPLEETIGDTLNWFIEKGYLAI